jgi:hypothetical protein
MQHQVAIHIQEGSWRERQALTIASSDIGSGGVHKLAVPDWDGLAVVVNELNRFGNVGMT